MNREDFLCTLAALGVNYSRTIEAPLVELWWNSFRDWPLAQFRGACQHHLQNSEFFPKISDLCNYRRSLSPNPAEAWTHVLAYVRSGAYQTGGGIDSLTDAAVAACGGYRAIAMSTPEQNNFTARRFAEAYASIADAKEARLRLDAPPLGEPARSGEVVRLTERLTRK